MHIRGLFIIAMCLSAGACGSQEDDTTFSGYLEADLVLVGAQQAGRITGLSVLEGDRVEKGQVIGLIDSDLSRADVAAAEARVEQARANLENARAAAQRPEEIAILQASLASARTRLTNAQSYFDRIAPLAPDAVSAVELDNARATRDQAAAQVEEIERRIEAARLGARTEQIEAAEATVSEAEASLFRAEEALVRYAVPSPADGTVEEIYFRPGEIVAAGQPVIGLLPPANLKVRFFVPQAALASLSPGKTVTLSCDGCPSGLSAEIRFIAREAEFTPPVILSEQRRDKLVFLVEAQPVEMAADLPAGLPVTVSLPDGR